MNLGEAKKGDVLVLTAEGRLDADTADDVQGQLQGLFASGEKAVLLDFSKLDYISSAGLRVLLVAAKHLKESDGRFAICSLNDNVAEVFAVSGFGSFIDVHPDEASALAAMTS